MIRGLSQVSLEHQVRPLRFRLLVQQVPLEARHPRQLRSVSRFSFQKLVLLEYLAHMAIFISACLSYFASTNLRFKIYALHCYISFPCYLSFSARHMPSPFPFEKGCLRPSRFESAPAGRVMMMIGTIGKEFMAGWLYGFMALWPEWEACDGVGSFGRAPAFVLISTFMACMRDELDVIWSMLL